MEKTTLNTPIQYSVYSVVNQKDFENPSVQTHFRSIFHREIPPRQLFFQMFLLLRNKHLSLSQTGSLTQCLTFCLNFQIKLIKFDLNILIEYISLRFNELWDSFIRVWVIYNMRSTDCSVYWPLVWHKWQVVDIIILVVNSVCI